LILLKRIKARSGVDGLCRERVHSLAVAVQLASGRHQRADLLLGAIDRLREHANPRIDGFEFSGAGIRLAEALNHIVEARMRLSSFFVNFL